MQERTEAAGVEEVTTPCRLPPPPGEGRYNVLSVPLRQCLAQTVTNDYRTFQEAAQTSVCRDQRDKPPSLQHPFNPTLYTHTFTQIHI